MENIIKNQIDEVGAKSDERRTTRSTVRQSLEGDVAVRSPRVVLERIASVRQEEAMELAEQTFTSCRSRESSSGRSDRKRPRRDVSEDRESVGAYAASDCESEVSLASSTRSRACVTHGRYVGLHRQREEYRRLAAESAQPSNTDQAKKAEEERQKRDARAAVRDLMSSGLQPLDPAAAKAQIDGGLMAVLEVARASKNIKGCFIKKMKDAVEDIQGGVRALTSDKRMERLLEENQRLTERLNALEEAQGKSLQRRTAPAAQEDEEERMQRIMLSVGTMMDAKLAGVISRLPPEPIMRPPLAADRRRAEAEAAGRGHKPGYSQVVKAAPAPKTSASKTTPTPAPRQAPKPTPKPDPKPAKGKAKKVVQQAAPQEAPALAPTTQEAPVAGTSETVEEGWTTVSNKKKKAPKPKAPEKPAAKPAKKTPPTQKQEGRKSTGPKKESGRTRRRRLQRQRRLARTAAVVLTISEEGAQKAITYETVLRQARETIDLDKMGVDMVADPIRIRRAQTGARILQLPKNIGQEAADDMAQQLRAKYGGDVRVSRPVRCAELRVSNLDESVTQQDIRDVATRQGQCTSDQIKVGDLRPSPGAKFSTVLKCPLEVASRLVTSKTQKFLVGWSSARVVQLDARPMKCFRCLALGHTRPVCMCPTDRSGLCYRCAMPGHKAVDCKAPAKCAICAELGRNAAHQMGSRGCAPPALIKKKMAAMGKVPVAVTSQARPCEEERMDEQ